jgi:TolB-like protein/Flp pilus assembly protein TadD
MEPERWQSIERLYHAALEVEESRRPAFLQDACGGDEALRREIEVLLSREKRAEKFMETPALEVAARTLAQDRNQNQPKPSLDEDELHLAGKTISHYKVLAKLGGGGMGVVYEAEDIRLGRRVALKFLPEKLAGDERSLQRFQREARAASSLNHPNICTIYEVEEHDHHPVIVMELLEGKSLKQRISEGPISTDELLDFGIQTSDALEAAHAKGIIHRDMKPGNIFVVGRGRVKILDFGLAKVLSPHVAEDQSEEESLTLEGVIPGTTSYMSPEQVRGEEIDARSDLFSLGVVLYEMATGQRPFVGKNRVVLMNAVLNTKPSAPTEIKPSLPSGLDPIIAMGLEKDRERRYQHAADICSDLKRLKGKMEKGPAEVASAAPVRLNARRTRNATARHKTIWRGGLFGLGLLLLLALATVVWRQRHFGMAAAVPISSIAVLPLVNLSGDAGQEYFADGMTEALTTDLARMENVQVISRSSTMQYKDTKKLLPDIAHELHADAIVEGSVQRSGNRVRVTAQLIRAATDKHLWAETYERDFRDILALQDDVASAIAKQIESKLGGAQPQPLPKAQRISAEAYEAYLKANSYQDQFDLQKSIDYYNQAIKLDSNYAPAYAHMANSYFFLGFFSAIPPNQAWGKVKELAMLAIEKDDQLPEGHAALASAKLHYDWDFPGAEREFKRALELNHSDADIRHGYAHFLMAMGRMDESAAESRRAVDLDPVDDELGACLCWHRFAAHQYDNSIKLTLDMLKRQPDDPFELAILGWNYEQTGVPEQAVAEFKKAVELTGKDSPLFTFLLAGLGHAYALSGRRSDAEQILQSLLERTKRSYVSPFDIALIYSALGEKDTAFAWMTKAVAERSTWLVYSKWEPRLDPLRSDPRFQDLLHRIGLAT